MSFTDRLPDRPLRFSEFQALQRNENIDHLATDDSPGLIDVLIVNIGDNEVTYHDHERDGWHRMNHG
jgi:hypothetical protein